MRVVRPTKDNANGVSDGKLGCTFTISMADDDFMLLEAESEKEAEEWAIKVVLAFPDLRLKRFV